MVICSRNHSSENKVRDFKTEDRLEDDSETYCAKNWNHILAHLILETNFWSLEWKQSFTHEKPEQAVTSIWKGENIPPLTKKGESLTVPLIYQSLCGIVVQMSDWDQGDPA